MSRALFLTGHTGGSGRTFCTSNLAICLAEAGQRVLIADLDPLAGSLAFWGNLEMPERVESVQRHSVRPGLDLVLGLDPEDVPELYELLEEQYDLWLFDSGAPLDPALQPVFALCQDVVLMVQNHPLSWRTLPLFFEKLLSQKQIQPQQLAGILHNLREPVQNALDIELLLEPTLKNYLMPMVIPYSNLATRALLEQQSAWEFEGDESEFGWAIRQFGAHLGYKQLL